ncbi:MAG: RNA polymerase factor sigma-32 [Oligoflexia bacterium]|nr:RNA polymerase factor sigma-32 [Oligoflexia bacterium]
MKKKEENKSHLPAVVGQKALVKPQKGSLSVTDPLKRYIEEVSRYELIDPEEQQKIAQLFRETGDVELAKRLVTANLRLVVKIAMEYRSTYNNVLDLIQEGNVGLMKAVSNYDPYKGTRLSYYASWWIRSYILKFLLDNFRLVKIGTTQAQKKLFYNLMREKERLEAQGIEAGPKLLAENLNVKEKEVKEMSLRLSSRGGEFSIDQPLGEEGGSTAKDFLVDEQESIEDSLVQNQLKQILSDHISDFVKTLNEKERAVFSERMMSEEPKTLQEVADQFGLTRERARQIEVKVLEKLKSHMSAYFDPAEQHEAAK